MNEPFSSFTKNSGMSRSVEWLLPSEAGPDDGLLIWALDRNTCSDLPFEIREASDQHTALKNGLRLTVIDHRAGSSIGEYVFRSIESDSFVLEFACGSEDAHELLVLTANIIKSHHEYRNELRAMERLVRSVNLQRF